ncbi:MAG TPA: glycosyltransferase family 2 protein [Solirubrobacterales bacterium]|jgi:GT2 family glycosyltransferase|nr:glycosyltransferase family 2 protein [Solirubrobacterales bacterium]
MHDVCAVIVSHNGKRWLDACLGSLYASAGDIDLDIVVVDNGSDGSAAYVEEQFSAARTISCANRGFGAANNRGLETADARYVLFLNPDTEFLGGDLAELLAALDHRPHIGLAGARQVGTGGELAPSMRRFPSTLNMLAEALAVERVPLLRRFLGERVLGPARYDRENRCDWTSGSFMLVRAEALRACGGFDERFFLFSEETDLCWRLKAAGWEVAHLPQVTIRHYESERSATPPMEAQSAYARLQFGRKHFAHVAPYRLAMVLRYALRARREAARAALETVLKDEPPLVPPPTPAEAQATIVSALGATRSSMRSRSPM